MPLEGSARAVHVFLSFANKDRAFRDALATHLRALQRIGLVADWDEYEILPGSEWQSVTDEHLNQADIILLLITPDFVASNYCYGVELKQALEKHDVGTARVIPILFRPTFWQDLPVARLQGLPPSKREGVKPVTEWRNKDKAYVGIVEGIKQAIEDLIKHLSEQKVSQPATSAPAAAERFWTIPYYRNPYFTARNTVVQTLHETFALRHGESTTLQILSGLGGVGKTQVAIEYAHRYSSDYKALLWVKGDVPEDLLADFTQLAQVFGLPESREPDQSIVVAAVKRYLQRAPRWLLIIDNLSRFDLIDGIIPQWGQGDILVTTQEQTPDVLASQYTLENMSLDESTLFLLQRAGFLKRADLQDAQTLPAAIQEQAREICSLVDRLPLALDQAGAYIRENQLTLLAYIELYQTYMPTFLKQRGKPITGHPASVAMTFSLCLQKVQQRHPAAAELFRFCAFLHPDAIPLELLVKSAEKLGPVLQPVVSHVLQLNTVLKALLDLSLVQRNTDNEMISLQRLAQIALRDEMDKATQSLWAERVLQALHGFFPEPEFEVWPQCERYLPHVLVLADVFKPWINDEIFPLSSYEAAQLLHRAGKYLYERANYANALAFCEQALLILTSNVAVPIEKRSETAQLLDTLGAIAQSQGNYAQAQGYYERALAMGEQVWGPENPLVARLLNHQGEFFQTQGKFAQAEVCYRRALALHERSCGLESPDTAESLNNLAGIYDEQGDYARAEPLYEQSFALRKRLLVAPHPELAISFSNLARFYRVLGKYRQAEPLYQQATAMFVEAFGPEHPRVAICLNNAGVFYLETARYVQAEQLLDQAIQLRILLLGLEHPSTAGSWNNLARVYTKQGRYQEGHILLQKVLSIRTQKLGSDHPDTMATLVNLGELFLAERDLANAEKVLTDARTWYRQRSENHPDLARVLDLQGQLFMARSEYEPAEQAFLAALAMCREHLGEMHPQTGLIMKRLGDLSLARNTDEQAAYWYEQAFVVTFPSPGVEHPEVAELLESYRTLLQRTGQDEKAQALLERVHEMTS